VPVALTEEIGAPSGDMGLIPFWRLTIRWFRALESYNRAGDYYIRNVDTFAQLGPVRTSTTDSQFYVVPGLADPDAVSIMSVFGSFLNHQGNNVFFTTSDGSEEFAENATWWIRPGLADDTWISFESYNQPGRYLGRQFGIMALVELTESSPRTALEAATFLEEN
jgi:hypothetical protein